MEKFSYFSDKESFCVNNQKADDEKTFPNYKIYTSKIWNESQAVFSIFYSV